MSKRVSDERIENVIGYCDSPERQGYPVPFSEFKNIMLDLRDCRAALREAETKLQAWNTVFDACRKLADGLYAEEEQ